MRAAAGLLERALSLTRPLRPDVDAELALAAAFLQEPARAKRIAEEAAVLAAEAGDESGEALAHAMAVYYGFMIAPGSPDELEALLLDARRRLEEAEDHAGLAQVWWALGFGVANMRGRQDDWATAALQARHHSRLAGRLAPSADLGAALVCGSRPADEALEIVDRVLAETPSAWLRLNRGWLLAMLGRGDEAREIAEEESERLREQGDARWGEWIVAEISILAGDYEDASNRLRIVCEWIEAMGQLAFLDSTSGSSAKCSASSVASTRRSNSQSAREPSSASTTRRRSPNRGTPGARCSHVCTRTGGNWPRPSGWHERRWP